MGSIDFHRKQLSKGATN